MTTAAPATSSSPPRAVDAALWRRQVGGVLRLELRRQWLSGRSFLLYFLALMPLLIVLTWTVSPLPERLGDPAATQPIFTAIFELGYVRVLIFLGTLLVFTGLFRSEILEKSLHYYFLTPVRREVLVVGKYLSALTTTGAVFSLSTVCLYLLLRSPWGWGVLSSHLFNGPGLGHLLSYAAIAFLACAGYGAIFMLIGLFVRNPIVPGALIWGWEWLNPFLPQLLKKISVVHYLHGLYPIPLSGRGFFEILADPTPAWVAIPGLLVFIAVVLAAISWKVRQLEISYGGD